jgi:hypothetical protein
MLDLMAKLVAHRGERDWLAYLASHPSGADRLAAIAAKVEEMEGKPLPLRPLISQADWAVLKKLATRKDLSGDPAL